MRYETGGEDTISDTDMERNVCYIKEELKLHASCLPHFQLSLQCLERVIHKQNLHRDLIETMNHFY